MAPLTTKWSMKSSSWPSWPFFKMSQILFLKSYFPLCYSSWACYSFQSMLLIFLSLSSIMFHFLCVHFERKLFPVLLLPTLYLSVIFPMHLLIPQIYVIYHIMPCAVVFMFVSLNPFRCCFESRYRIFQILLAFPSGAHSHLYENSLPIIWRDYV